MRALATVVVLLILVMQTLPAGSQVIGTTHAEVYPAPFGFVFVFSQPLGEVVGFKGADQYYNIKADLTESTTLISLEPTIDYIVTKRGSYSVVEALANYTGSIYVLDLPGPRDLILRSGSVPIVYSNYYVTWQYPPQEPVPDNRIALLSTDMVNLTIDVVHVLFVPDPTDKVTVYEYDKVFVGTISDLLNVPLSCVVKFTPPPEDMPWTGGILPTPVCTQNIVPVKTEKYLGDEYIVAFTLKNPSIEYIAFSKPSAYVLYLMGLLSIVESDMYLNVVPVTISRDLYFYYVSVVEDAIYPLKVYDVNDATIVTAEGNYSCMLPPDSKILFTLQWGYKKLEGTVHLKPGEAILFESGGEIYLCRGDLSFLETPPTPTISAPTFREFGGPVKVISTAGPILVVTANGQVYYGRNIVLPNDVIAKNTVWYVGSYSEMLTVTQRSIIFSPFFILSMLLGAVFIAVILQGRVAPKRRLRLIWTELVPPPATVASREDVRAMAEKNVNNFGVCPTDEELALYYKILPPLEPGHNPRVTRLICPFRTNPRSELVLREVARILWIGFWSLKRRGRSHGFIYTIIGDLLLLMYFYKQEDEVTPQEIILNGILKAMRTYVGFPYHTEHLGLVLIVEDTMIDKVKGELEILRKMQSETGKLDLSPYISFRFPDLPDSQKKAITSFTSNRIPRIMVIGKKNITELIEYLAWQASDRFEEHLRRLGELRK